MKLKPFPHQVIGTNYLIDNNGGAIYSDPRSGKTLMVLEALNKSGNFPALIICPSTVIASWVGALLEYGVSENDITEFSINKSISELKSLIMHNTKYFICNYEKVAKLNILNFRKMLSGVFELPDWKAIVIDESYKIASFDSTISQHIMDFEYNNDQMRICLTGTPICESPLDAVQPYIFLNGNFFGFTNPFKYRNSNYTMYAYKWKANSRIHTAKVERYVKENSYQVRLCDLNLGGEILYGMDALDMTERQIRLYQWVALAETYEVDGETMQMYPAIRAIFWRKISSGLHPLTNEVIDLQKAEHIAEQISDGTKALIMTKFTKIIPAIENVLKQHKIKYGVIRGSVSLSDRECVRKEFQCGEIQAVIIQVDAGARGLDFSNADKIYYYSNSYSYEVRKQSSLRAQNVNRLLPYNVVDLCFRSSIDVEIRKILLTKESNVSKYIKEIDQAMLKKWS